MQLAANYVRDKLVESKGKLAPEETQLVRDFQSNCGSYSLWYGSTAFGLNYIVTRPLRQTKAAWIRTPLNVLAFGIGVSMAFQQAARQLIYDFYALPDSKLASEGREWLKKTDPTSPILLAAQAKLTKRNSLAANALGSSIPPRSNSRLSTVADTTVSDSISLDSTQNGKQEVLFEEPGISEFDLVAPGSSGLSSTQSMPSVSKAPANFPPLSPSPKPSTSMSGSKDDSTRFRGEDAFAPIWEDGSQERSSGHKTVEKRSSKNDNQGRSWDEVRQEWLQQKAAAQGGSKDT